MAALLIKTEQYGYSRGPKMPPTLAQLLEAKGKCWVLPTTASHLHQGRFPELHKRIVTVSCSIPVFYPDCV